MQGLLLRVGTRLRLGIRRGLRLRVSAGLRLRIGRGLLRIGALGRIGLLRVSTLRWGRLLRVGALRRKGRRLLRVRLLSIRLLLIRLLLRIRPLGRRVALSDEDVLGDGVRLRPLGPRAGRRECSGDE